MLLVSSARAEEVESAIDALDLSSWQEAAGEEVDVRALVTSFARGDLEGGLAGLGEEIRAQAAERIRSLLPTLMALMAPVLLHALLSRLLKGKTVASAACTVCFLAEASALIALFGGEIVAAREAVFRTGSLGERIYPVLGALLAAGGGVHTAAFFQSASGALLALLTPVYRVSFALCSVAAVLAVAGNMSVQLRLSGLFSLARSANNWLMGLTITLFLGAMGTMGLLGTAQDSVAMRTAKYTVDNLLPVIGGEVADTLDSVAASAHLARNAAGVTGAVLLLGSCLVPIVRLTLAIICVQLAGALTEPIFGGPLAACLDQFGKVLKMLLVALSACAALFLVLVGAVLRAVNAIAMLG